MADLPYERKNIQIEETQFRASVSESFSQKIGSAINFINDRQYDTKTFQINGRLQFLTNFPILGIDGMIFVPFNIEVFEVMVYQNIAGTSGTTDLDVKYATTPGGSFASIFTQSPKIASVEGNYSWITTTVYSGSSVNPILAPIVIPAGSALRLDCIAVQSGDPRGAGIVLLHRPVN